MNLTTILVALIGLIIGAAVAYILAMRAARQRNQEWGEAQRRWLEERQKLNSDLAVQANSLAQLQKEIAQTKDEAARSAASVVDLTGRVAALQATNESLARSKAESIDLYKHENQELKSKSDVLRNENQALLKRVSAFEESKEQRNEEHGKMMAQMNRVFEQRNQEIERERLAKENAEAERLRLLDETWQRHESAVEERMKMICQRQVIDYVPKEKFPYKGKPDNCVFICNEHIVFDSKSPAGDDLANFPTYIKREAEAAKKYAVEGVKNDIFLVVPSNAIHVIKDTFLNFAKYRVHVITPDALEPILISLKKIEDYEFAEKLNPDDREKIVSVLGKFAHNMKRKVQIDQFMNNETIALLMDAEKLPGDILADAQKIERSSMLNPPQERRNKTIETSDLAKEAQKLIGKGAGQEIDMEIRTNVLAGLPLHKSAQKRELTTD